MAQDTASAVEAYLDAEAPVCPFLADQLLLPIALAGAGSFHTTTLSAHTRTNLEVIQQFLDTPITANERDARAEIAAG